MERQPAEEFVSKLPPFTAKRSSDFPAFLIVMCGYEDCPGTQADRPFLVSEREWMRPLHRVSKLRGVDSPFVITGRSCPYCFRAGRLPKRREIR
jgi:hypothetical protein